MAVDFSNRHILKDTKKGCKSQDKSTVGVSPTVGVTQSDADGR
jgi:hypothetical protein